MHSRRLRTIRNGRIGRAIWIAVLCVLGSTPGVLGQPLEQVAQPPKLIFVLPQVFGPDGLFVDSTTHRAHFNASFEAGFAPINLALARQLATSFVPPPVSAGGYGFSADGLFHLSPQRFGVVFSERSELIGSGEIGFGLSMQHADYSSLDGISLEAIPTAFTHDSPELGGIRNDVVTAVNQVEARQTQLVGFLTYGLGSRLDLSLAVPLVTTQLKVMSLATLQRFGSVGDVRTHFFEEESDPFGSSRVFGARGRATGIGDVTVRFKGAFPGAQPFQTAFGLDIRVPIGDAENLLGSGALGLRPFVAWSHRNRRVSPHGSVSYQWNGSSVLAGSPGTSEKGDLSDEVGYAIGAAISLTRRVNITVDLLGRYILNTLRLTPAELVSVTGVSVPTVAFGEAALHRTHAAVGITTGTAWGLRAHAGVLMQLDGDGLRDTFVPLGGAQYGF